MKMNLHLIYILGLLVLAGCLEPVDDLVLPQNDFKLVVVSNFSNDNSFKVIVSKSRSFDDITETEYVPDALVKIFSDGEELAILDFYPSGLLEDTLPCYISTNLKAEIGRQYEIRVSAPGFPTVSAYGMIPLPTKIESSKIEPDNDHSGDADPFIWLTFTINDDLEEENYYHLNVYQLRDELVQLDDNEEMQTKMYGPLQMFSFDPNAPVTFYIENRGGLITDKSFNGKIRRFTFRTLLERRPVVNDNSKIVVELMTVSKDYYLYYLNLKRQNDTYINPLSEPIGTFSNIENGFGIFAGFSVIRDTLTISH